MHTTLTIPSVTGIDLELRIAGPGGRSYAFVIDWHIRVLAALAWLLVGTFILLGSTGLSSPADALHSGGAAVNEFTYAVLLPSVAIYLLYHPLLEVVMRGRTPGKRIAGVRLVKRDGGIPGPGALLIRNAFRLIDSLPLAYVVGLTCTLLTAHSLRIGDIAAGTLLVYDEQSAIDVLGTLAPEDVERLGLRNAELVRDLLIRWNEIQPNKRKELADRLLKKLGVHQPASTGDGRRQQLQALLHEYPLGR
jgi:uncharacterized RDD family membrane protein YckC